MRRGYVMAVLFLMTILLAAGCGADEYGTDDNPESKEYIRIAGLDSTITASGSGETGKTETIVGSLVQEAAGNEATEEREVAGDADIYSKPGDEGVIVGLAEKGTTVQTIQILEGGEWYKIVYQGRVAYIPAKALEENEPGINSAQNNLAQGTSVPEQSQAPTERPAAEPTQRPTTEPTAEPTQRPTTEPTQRPTTEPTTEPTQRPTTEPSPEPTQSSTAEPTPEPTQRPTPEPSPEPTQSPTAEPSPEPTQSPTAEPSPEPTQRPTTEPSPEPTAEPTPEPTQSPTAEPTAEPTPEPTAEPTLEPTPEPTPEPTSEPMPEPTPEPAPEPTQEITRSAFLSYKIQMS